MIETLVLWHRLEEEGFFSIEYKNKGDFKMRMLRRDFVKVILVLVLLGSFAVGCSSGDSSEPVDQVDSMDGQTLVMGLDDTFAPMGFRDDKGELVGFDIDLANEVSKRLEMNIEFQPIDWSMKETELNAGNIDCIWNGYSITDERKEMVAFSQAYLANAQIVVTLSDSPVNLLSDLEGLVVSTQAESSAVDAANAKEGFVESLKNGEIIEFATNNEAFNDLEAGRSDAIVVDEVLARYYMSQNGEENYKVLEENLGPEEFAVGFRKSDTELLQSVNDAFDDMRSDGTYDEIYEKWFSKN